MNIDVRSRVLEANDRIADENRRRLDSLGICAINLMGSPGAGKTSLILRTIEALRGHRAMAVIEGDIATSIDADDIAQTRTPVLQINTGGTCHLDAAMVAGALGSIELEPGMLLIIENVGNLVCPASYRLGEQLRAVVLGATEGSDKPFKYPKMFVDIDAVIVNKLDLAHAVDFEREEFIRGVRTLTDADIIEVSCRSGDGLDNWMDWIGRRAVSVVRPASTAR